MQMLGFLNCKCAAVDSDDEFEKKQARVKSPAMSAVRKIPKQAKEVVGAGTFHAHTSGACTAPLPKIPVTDNGKYWRSDEKCVYPDPTRTILYDGVESAQSSIVSFTRLVSDRDSFCRYSSAVVSFNDRVSLCSNIQDRDERYSSAFVSFNDRVSLCSNIQDRESVPTPTPTPSVLEPLNITPPVSTTQFPRNESTEDVYCGWLWKEGYKYLLWPSTHIRFFKLYRKGPNKNKVMYYEDGSKDSKALLKNHSTPSDSPSRHKKNMILQGKIDLQEIKRTVKSSRTLARGEQTQYWMYLEPKAKNGRTWKLFSYLKRERDAWCDAIDEALMDYNQSAGILTDADLLRAYEHTRLNPEAVSATALYYSHSFAEFVDKPTQL